ncbi:MAG: hypothetical protein U0637_01250 [Phycisphaerales bacterium]
MTSSVLLVVAGALMPALDALAQCPGSWVQTPMTAQGFSNRPMCGAIWDMDGPGPVPAGPVVCGEFLLPGSAAGSYDVAAWDGAHWVRVGDSFNMWFRSVHVTAANELYVGGDFTSAGAVSVARIARFSGTAWQPLGTGCNSTVQAMTSAGGSVYAGGWFTQAGGTFNSRVARWNGSAWSIPGGGNGANNWVWGLATMPNGTVVAGGAFSVVGSVAASRLAAWNGAAWAPIGGGVSTGSEVYETFAMPNGDLIASGNFTSIGGVSALNVARWNGTAWSAMGAGFPLPARSFAVLGGDLYAAGMPSSDFLTNQVRRWTGSEWEVVGAADSTIFEILPVSPDEMLVLGSFLHVGGQAFTRAAVYRRGNCPVCDAIDFNGDGLFPDTADIDDFLAVFSGGACSTGACGDIDFNNDGLFPDTTDIDSLLSVFSGGPCL